MRAFVRTWRHGQPADLGYHGSGLGFDAGNMLLHVLAPVLSGDDEESRIGAVTTVTILAGDEFTVEQCPPSCRHHPSEISTPEELAGRLLDRW